MKKLLPKTVSNPKGFTLVELLVVISIIAILAVIGVSTYTGAQGSARDATRVSELSSIAKSIESSKDFQTNTYKYTTANGGTDFPRGFPPTNSQSVFCIAASTAVITGANTADPTTNWTTACPTGWTLLNTSMSTNTTGNLGATTPDVKSWKICAAMERGTAFCQKSLY